MLTFFFELSITTISGLYVIIICDMIKGNEPLVEIFNSYFLTPLSHNCFILMQTPLQLDIWLQSYEEFVNVKNVIKQRNWNTVFANISKPISQTSDSFLLIMSHILIKSKYNELINHNLLNPFKKIPRIITWTQFIFG